MTRCLGNMSTTRQRLLILVIWVIRVSVFVVYLLFSWSLLVLEIVISETYDQVKYTCELY